MDITYLAVTLFGMCAAVCRSMPTAAVVTVATIPSSSSSPVTGGQRQAVNDNGARAVNGGNEADGKRSRSLQQFPQLPSYNHYDEDVQYDDVTANDLAFYAQQQQQRIDGDDSNYAEQQAVDARLSSRARPGKPADSPVYFIRLPPQPYVYVPGYGYVSQPTRLEPPPFTQRPHSPFMNLPLGYVSNGKPVGVYTLPQQQQQQHHDQQYHQQQYQYQNQQQQQQQQQQQRPQPAGRPKPNRRPQVPPVQVVQQPQMVQQPPQEVVGMPDSPVYELDKGPYVFNGRPSDAYLLHTAYDNLYSEVLQNIYP